jgi:chromosome segregation ATPase
MSAQFSNVALDSAITPDGIRKFFETMDRGDLVENAVDAIFRSQELQALFDSMKGEQERSTTHTQAAERHIVDLTGQIKARDLAVHNLKQEKIKREDEFVGLQKERDALVLQINGKDEELKKTGDGIAHYREQIEKLNKEIVEQEDALRAFQSTMKVDAALHKQLQIELSDLRQALQKIQGEKDALVVELQKNVQSLRATESEKEVLRTTCEEKDRLIAQRKLEAAALIAETSTLKEEVAARSQENARHVVEKADTDVQIAALRGDNAAKDREIAHLQEMVTQLREKNRKLKEIASLKH